MSRYILRIITDPTRPDRGPFLASADVNAVAGRGEFSATLLPGEALTFPSQQEAVAFYQQQSTVQPLRDDGQPNRPLTALTVVLEPLDDLR